MNGHRRAFSTAAVLAVGRPTFDLELGARQITHALDTLDGLVDDDVIDHVDGLDALLSTVQMPAGIPVASVAIGKAGAKNVAYLAAQILGVADSDLGQKLRDERAANAEAIYAKDASLQKSLKG